MFKRHMLVVAAFILTGDLLAQVPLARNGQPVAEIVLSADAPPPMRYAAEELQLHVELISGAKLPILQAPGTATHRIVLAVAPVGYEDDVRRIGATDGYAVRTRGNTVTVLGAIPKGVLNGVYKLLTRNSDLIWARPDPEFGTLFTKNPDFALTQTDWIDIPVYILRGWQMGGKGERDASVWQIRQGSNWTAANMSKGEESARFGTVLEYGGGHNLTGLYITGAKYFKDHPDYFPFFNGARQDPRAHKYRTQLCFSNTEMTAAFIRELDARIAQAPDYDTYRIMIEDVWQMCECPECVKPLVLEDGTTVEFKDEDFRSTQFFLWLNTIARHFQKNWPGKRILTFAYFFTEIPPRIKIEPNISISFCPIQKDSKKRIDEPGNEQTLERFHKWIANTPEITWREYFGLCAPFPRPIDAVALYDWSYVNRHGVKRTYSEMRSDAFIGGKEEVRSWDVNAPYFWVIANAAWNPARDVESLRNEFFTRVYGPAASDVKAFYTLIEKSFFTTPGISRYNDRAALNWRQSVVNAGLVDDCRAALDRAAAKGLDGKRGAMLAALRTVFDFYIGLLKNSSVSASRATTPPALDPLFASGDWAKAKPAKMFFVSNRESLYPQRTELRVLYDERNLYFGIRCSHPDPKRMEYWRDPGADNRFLKCEHFEIFLRGGWDAAKPFVQMAVDPAGNRYSGVRSNRKWSAQAQVTDDGWSALVTVAWADLKLDPAKTSKLQGAFIRQYLPPTRLGISPSTYAALFDTMRHNEHGFCDIVLDGE